MMKKYLIILILIACMLQLAKGVLAQEASPTATPTIDKTKQIEDLKERLATKVAQLRQTQRAAIAGTIKSTSVSTLVVETKTKDVKIELTDDIRVYQYLKGTRTKLTVDDLEKDDAVVVFGENDTTLDILKANVVFIQAAPPLRIFGIVADVDRTEYTITTNNPQGQSYVIDIEKTTKTFRWNGEKIEKSGFSKVTVGDIVFVLGTPVPKLENRYSALRILDIGNPNGTASSASSSLKQEESTPSATPKTTKTTPAETP